MRGTEELLSQSGTVGNGNSLSPESNESENNNEAKKVKLDRSQAGKVSKVVHIRNVPTEATEGEIMQIGNTFGRVTGVLLLKGKNQALLELSDETAASAMVNYCLNSNSPLIRGRSVYVQFSNYQELKRDNNHISSTQNVDASSICLATSPVVRIVIENHVYPITLDLLYQSFAKFGTVLKIVTFGKNATFQALVQFSSLKEAETAKNAMDGKPIFAGCNIILKVEYSKMTNLMVKFNNDKSRDFTNPCLPSGDLAFDSFASLSSKMNLGSMGVLASPFGTHGFGAPLTAYTAGAGGMALPHFYRDLHFDLNKPPSLPLGSFALSPAAAASAALGVTGLRLPTAPSISTVLLVSSLNEEKVTPDALFTLFGVYGDVQRVKILFNKKDNALVQMAEPQQAQLAMTHLDKLKVFGKQIRVAPSRHQVVQMPKEGQPDAGLTKDYSNSPLHRFKKPGSKNYLNIYAPSSTLHLSNIPPSVSEEQIKQAFTDEAEVTVHAFKFFPKDRKMALIQMTSVEEAVVALIKMHNYQLSDSSHLRVSFSKSTI